MDHTAVDFVKYEKGCNYCTTRATPSPASSEELTRLVEGIKRDGKKRPFDVIVGVSGGVDSSYVLHLCHLYDLRALAVHMDNSWNSALATTNIEKVVSSYAEDFHVKVLDWNRYRQMQLAFMQSDVVDIELLYDNAAIGTVHHTALKYGVKHVLNGVNLSTEGLTIPQNWKWYKYDALNIKDISSRYGVSDPSFPYASTIDRLSAKLNYKITNILDFVEYEKSKALTKLSDDVGYKKYAGKHEESSFTKFYQDVILPLKFGIDKRKVHLSDLILNNEISRTEALTVLTANSIDLEKFLDEDVFILNKLKMEKDEFIKYLNRDRKEHHHFKSEYYYVKKIKNILRL